MKRYYEAEAWEVDTYDTSLDVVSDDERYQAILENLPEPVTVMAANVREAINFMAYKGYVDVVYHGTMVTSFNGTGLQTIAGLESFFYSVNTLKKNVLDLEFEDYSEKRIWLRSIRFAPGIDQNGHAVARLILIGVGVY